MERGLAGFVEVGEVALGVDLAHERALAPVGGEHAEGGGDGGLAHPALARDEQQAAVEETDGGARAAPGGGCAQDENPIERLSESEPSST